MTKDELLKYAKENYPIGTKYKCPINIGDHRLGLGINIVELGDEIEFRRSDEIDIIGKGYIYYKGEWAEILEKPKVEPEFEKGKWYKILDNWYGKFETVHNSGKRIKFSEYITSNGTYMYSTNNIDFISEIKPLTNLSEIQQYLPDGHPDKFTTSIAKEFVLPKKWCVKVTSENKNVLTDWVKSRPNFNETYLPIKHWIVNTSNKDNSYQKWIKSLPGNFVEITFNQFKKYVLKEEVKEEVKHIERWSVGSYIVALKNSCICISKFNTGDIAIVLNNSEISLLSDNSIWDCYKDRDISNNDVKWFPTLQEAQKFSNELLGKSKTGLRVEDLVEGEIYVNGPDNGTMWCYIIKYYKNSFKKAVGLYKTGVYSAEYCNYMGDYTEGWLLRLATPDEKKWLNTCIKQDKFIEQSELNKYDDEGNLMEKNEEYPEYVECIYSTDSRFTVNKIYKVKSRKESCLVILSNNGKNENTGGYPLNGILWKFKPSTKEAYLKMIKKELIKKDEKFKNGDWLVYIGDCGCSPSTPIKIGDVRQMIEGRFGSLSIYGVKDLSQYFRKALPNEIPVNNSIKEEPKLAFPYKVGDRIRCIKLMSWTDDVGEKYPINKCEGKIIKVTKIGDLNEEYGYIPFAATYDGVEYGFSYSDDNKYELVESFDDFVRAKYVETLHQMDFLPVKPEEYYLNKQEVKNPLDDSEREVNINFSKPKQIKF